jgi:acyl carrier protein
MSSDLKEALRTALVTQFRVDRRTLDDDTGLFSQGLIDSLSVMDLVAFVEGKIGRPIDPAHITLENFDSVARIVRYVGTIDGAGTGS